MLPLHSVGLGKPDAMNPLNHTGMNALGVCEVLYQPSQLSQLVLHSLDF